MNKVEWDYFDKFNGVINKYMPDRGEGETMASQIVTAINKLIYKWYNDGDVFDNTHALQGWCNNLSSYANWLAKNVTGAEEILDNIFTATGDDDYELLLQKLADTFLNEITLKQYKVNTVGSIYECEGKYQFIEGYLDDEEDW